MDVFGEASVLFTLLAANTFNDVYNLTGLMSDATRWLLTLIPTAGVLMVIYFVLARNSAQDEHTAAQHTKSIRNVLMGTILGLGASGLISTITHYVDADGLPAQVTTASAPGNTVTAPAATAATTATGSTAATATGSTANTATAPAGPAATGSTTPAAAASSTPSSGGTAGSTAAATPKPIVNDENNACQASAARQGGQVISAPGAPCAIQLSSGKVANAAGLTITPPWCIELAKRHGGTPSTSNGLGCNVAVSRGTGVVYVVRNQLVP